LSKAVNICTALAFGADAMAAVSAAVLPCIAEPAAAMKALAGRLAGLLLSE
jgi:hypothetical protein